MAMISVTEKRVSEEMPVATIYVGCHHDEEGSPLVVADGVIVGTVDYVKEMIDAYELRRGAGKRVAA